MKRKAFVARLLPMLIFVALLGTSNSLKSQTGNEVLLQAFNWESSQNGWWSNLNGKVDMIANSGIDVVWLPPASKSEDSQGYRPTEYNNINNSYGSKTQLQTLISSFHAKGIKVLADIVINHREGSGSCQAFYNPDWGNWSICNNDGECPGSGSPDTGEGFNAGRDLDHTNTGVQDGIKWMMQGVLKNEIGFDGWRYDYAKGYDGKYVGMYNKATSPYMSVGEYWKSMNYKIFDLLYDQDSHRQAILSWITATDNTACAMDFTSKGMLQEAVQYSKFHYLKDAQGKPTGLIGLTPSKAVTFIDNHDTGGSQNHWPFHGESTLQKVKEEMVMQGYAYILTHPGIPCVFWDHLVTWGTGNAIKELISIRKKNGIFSESTVAIQKAVDKDCYAAIVDGSKGKVAMVIGAGTWAPTGNWVLAAEGYNYKVWESNVSSNAPALNISPTGGTYIGGTTVTLTASGNNPPFTIYYTTDGATPTTSSLNVPSGGKINITSNTTLKAWAVDALSEGSTISINTYITKEPGFTVYFKKPPAWTTAYIHAWGPAPDYTAQTGAWPGKVMLDAGNGWYSYNFPTQPTVNIIFNNGLSGANEIKTKDITNVTEELWYDFDMGVVTATAQDVVDNTLCLFPNPVSDKLYVRSNLMVKTVSISNLLGERVWLIENIHSDAIRLNLSDLNKGVYFISFFYENGQCMVKKIIKNQLH